MTETAPAPTTIRREALLVGALTIAALLLRVADLSAQPLIGDDLAVRATALNYVAAGWPGPTMWNHPRLRDLLVYASVEAIADPRWSVRLWSIVLGTLAAPATFVMVRALGGRFLAAAVAASLVASDPLHVDFSRQGINDVYLSFFSAAVVAAAWRHHSTRRPGWLVIAGVLLGLGLASKWAIAFPAAVAGGLALRDALRAPGARARSAELGFCCAALVLLPLAVYLLTFAPWFGRGQDLGEWVRLQLLMARETATHTGYAGTKLPGYAGEVVGAWRWFATPVYYVARAAEGEPAGATARYAIGVANPLAWLAVWPAAGLVLWEAWRKRHAPSIAILLLFASAYLPFALASRPIWTNSAPAIFPFAAAVVGQAFAAGWARARRALVAWLAVTLAAALVLWFPAVGLSGPGGAWVERLLPPAALR